MFIPIRAFDPTQRIIWEVVISFSTLLTGRVLNLALIPFFIFIGFLIQHGKAIFSLKWIGKLFHKSEEENGVIPILVKAVFLLLITYVCFYPVEAKIVMVESDGSNVVERTIEPSGLDPFKRFGIEINRYEIPVFVGAFIATFDYLLYSHDAGIFPYLFGSFYAEYVKDPYIIFKNYDLLMASNNLESMIEVTSENTKDSTLSSYKAINYRLKVIGEELFNLQGYNNERAHHFFVGAEISPQDHSTFKSEENHGYFGDYPAALNMSGYAEINIAYQGGMSTPDFAEKVEKDILGLKDVMPEDKNQVEAISNTVILPMKKCMKVMDSIQADIEDNREIGLDIKNKFIELIEETRRSVSNITKSLENEIISDIENIIIVRNFVQAREDKEDKHSDSVLKDSIAWVKNLLMVPFIFIPVEGDAWLAGVLRIAVFIFFQIVKFIYIIIFLLRSMYIGMSIATIAFALLKTLLVWDPTVMFSPIRSYIICRMWDFGFILAGLLGYAIPYSIATGEFGQWGMKDTGMTLAMAVALLMQVFAVGFFIKKIKWTLEPAVQTSMHDSHENTDQIENVPNNALQKTGQVGSMLATVGIATGATLVAGPLAGVATAGVGRGVFGTATRAFRFGSVSGRGKK